MNSRVMMTDARPTGRLDRKSTRLNSSHLVISYAVFCLKKKHVEDHYAGKHIPEHGPVLAALLSATAAGLGRLAGVLVPAPSYRQILPVDFFFFFNGPATTESYPLPPHDALPI